jgi:hypothetical protein
VSRERQRANVLSRSPVTYPDSRLHFLRRVVHVGAGQVDLVEHGHNLEVVLEREVHVGNRLRLDALRSVDDEQRALARGERARHLVPEVDVPGRVDQVEHVPVAVVGQIVHARRLQLNGDAAFALNVHVVEQPARRRIVAQR